MRFCSGITRSGTRCTHSVSGDGQYCHLHDPSRAEERSRSASKAGRSKPSKVLLDLRSRLVELGEQVLAGEVEGKKAAVAAQVFGTALRALEIERKLKETEELERRLEELEQHAEDQPSQRDNSRRWR